MSVRDDVRDGAPVWLALGLAASTLLTGCILTQPVNTPEYTLGGAFFANVTSSDVQDLTRAAGARGVGEKLAILESQPMQFRVVDLDSPTCEALHDDLVEKPYLSRLDLCRPESAPAPTEESVPAST